MKENNLAEVDERRGEQDGANVWCLNKEASVK